MNGMMKRVLPKQPILLVSYWKVGSLLHCSLILFVLESYIYWIQLTNAYLQEGVVHVLFWLWCLLFSFSHIFLVIMDAWSRFQNYKRIKDYFFVYGFKTKIVRHYSGSKCQRNALIVAAKELGLEQEVQKYYRKIGVRWYHFIPYFMIKDPLFLFRKYFWSRTFMEKYYEPKFDFRKLKQKISV